MSRRVSGSYRRYRQTYTALISGRLSTGLQREVMKSDFAGNAEEPIKAFEMRP